MTAPDRRFSLSPVDGLILALAVALGGVAGFFSDREFVAFRRWQEITYRPSGQPAPPGDGGPTMTPEARITRTVQDVESVVDPIVLGLAVVVYRPRRGGRPVRRRGPGHVALAVAAVLLGYGLLYAAWFFTAPTGWTDYQPGWPPGVPRTYWIYLPRGKGTTVGFATLAAWAYLALIRAWRGTGLPLERAGLWLGWFWVVATAVIWSLNFFPGS